MRDEANKLTKDFLESVFFEMFGDLHKNINHWKKEELRKIAKFIDYRGKTPTKSTSGIPLITAKNVKDGYLSSEPREFIPENEYESWMRRGFPQEGDVLFTTEAPLGNVAILGKFNKVALAQRIITLQPTREVNSQYLLFVLLSKSIKEEIHRYSTGSTAKGIRSKEFGKISIPLPPISIQNKFASIVKNIECMKEQQMRSKEEIHNLFDNLMQKTFNGELAC